MPTNEDSELKRVTEEFAQFRRRSRVSIEEARRRGRDEAALELVELVDDCDRALKMKTDDDPGGVFAGIEQLRRRALRHFEALGLLPFEEVGEQFDPVRHEAIQVEPGVGVDGTVLAVHQLGWARQDGQVVRPAMVTVLKGNLTASEPIEPPRGLKPTSTGADAGGRRRRRPEPEPVPQTYVCPYGTPGCTGDCAGCSPPAAPLPGAPAGRGEL